MNILVLMLIVAVIGCAAWLLTKYIPMPQGIRIVIYAIAIIAGALLAMNAFGFHIPNINTR